MGEPEGSSASPAGSDEELGACEPELPIRALAPVADLREEPPSHISASPDLQWLEELFAMENISGAKAARLKASFNLLHDTLRRTQESEMNLLQEEQSLRAELEHQQQELEKAELFQGGQKTEVSRLRQQLLQAQNKICEAENRGSQMQNLNVCLQEEKTCLEKEYESQYKPDEQEKLYLALKESCEEIRQEIAQRHQEVIGLTEDVEASHEWTQKVQQKLEHSKKTIESKEAELAQLRSMSSQLRKENERIDRKKMDMENHKAVLEKQLQEQIELKKKTQARCGQLEEECQEVKRELEGRRANMEVVQRESTILLRELEMTKEKKIDLLGQRALLDISMKHTMMESQSLHDNLSRQVREKDKLLRRLKKTQLELKEAQNSLTRTQELYNKTKSQRDIIPKVDGLKQKMENLQEEVINLKLRMAHQQSVTGLEVQTVEQCVEQEQALIRECNRHQEELDHLKTLTLIKADERNQKSQELLKAQVRYRRIKEDIRGKQLQIQEHKKQHQLIQSSLDAFAKMYNVVKGERDKCVNLNQIATQRTAEMREKFKILENEIEVLRTTAIDRDRLLQKSRLKHDHSLAVRDSLRKDISRHAGMLQEMQCKRDKQRLNISKLTHMIDCQEQELLHMRKSHDAAVQNRNELGVQLLEREEELCIIYEKVNGQESLIQKRSLEIQALEEEIHSLKMLITEERRHIDLCQKQVPCKRALEEELTLKQKQLSECMDRVLCLEKALEDHATEKRSRELSGEDPSHVELIRKKEQLEVRLAEKEAQLLEKELAYEQVTHLCQQTHAKVESAKENKLTLAKKVNEFQRFIRNCDKKLKAVAAELAMEKAQALRLQQDLREKELQLDSCQRRMELGLPPSDSIEEEWQRCLQDQHRSQADAERKARIAEEEERNQLPNGVYTTAEPRPNAYIPTEDSLPLPKPYGALAPFKPTKPGANMRHIRKPQPKPAEI
ncbi:coiled-coil domain-containing protein 146 [Salminus brasiliensis]|uniref:coiled-coil domain-containing protein 146 n=1 Tax=Salminus brasiliensis TaxID=930266 RepID=UPI003B82DA83